MTTLSDLVTSLNNLTRLTDARFNLTSLSTIGVATIPVLSTDESDTFRQAETEFPEFFPGAFPLVLGGYAAYGNPSSFHCPMVKNLRKETLQTVIDSQIFQKYLEVIRPQTHEQYGMELLFDRIMHRYPGQSPSAETAHRDVTPAKYLREQDDDHLFGGWLNMTGKPQTFTAQPGSHLGVNNTFEVAQAHAGFCKLDPKSDEYSLFQAEKKTFTVLPGHLIIFPQHLIHEIVCKKSPDEQFRLFFGWRLTKAKTVLFPNKEQTIDWLDVPLIPSGQKPPMYSSNHSSFYKNRPFEWAPGSNTGTLEEWWKQNVKVPVVTRHMQTIYDYQFQFPAYTIEEKKLMMTIHSLDTV